MVNGEWAKGEKQKARWINPVC